MILSLLMLVKQESLLSISSTVEELSKKAYYLPILIYF